RRQLFYVHNVAGKDEQIILVTEETDDKWQAPLSSIFEPNPKNPSELFFGSEKDGFNHLYLATIEQAETRPVGSVPGARVASADGPAPTGKVTITQVTKGNWQVEWAKWILDGAQIAFLSTQKGAAERSIQSIAHLNGHYYTLGIQGAGMVTAPQLSEQSSLPTLLFSRSTWNKPDELYSMVVCPGCPDLTPPRPLTGTVPTTFSSRKWTEPKFTEIPSRDGKKIPAKIYLPPGFNAKAKQKYPMVIFVHGAGYLQNVINGWNNYYREFMFNDLLAKRGYVVLDIDYRGSAGYGRDWRTDVYDFLGGKDYDDHIDSIDFMVQNYNVNQSRIGVYGGSYGGFMAGMLAMRAPERIAAAAALRPVFDWKNYYASSPGYTAQRLGFPDKNPEAYKRSSPITYADKLERPLLILHGMADDNVHVQDSVQLMEKLIRLGKTQYFEAMLYPSENHGFVRPESWADEYERILTFLEKHLK
ncbi:MAG TPA: alpha/beta fold hydrolase, partial [Pyrinomonadaceae bacterium]|nr:alpha/beta fold hydrolase [Pyrinomonadaceae bacterium]